MTHTPEEILERYTPMREYPNYYHESDVISAMQAYASTQQKYRLTKEQAYQQATLELLSDSNGTRMDIIYRAMDIYAASTQQGGEGEEAVKYLASLWKVVEQQRQVNLKAYDESKNTVFTQVTAHINTVYVGILDEINSHIEGLSTPPSTSDGEKGSNNNTNNKI